MYKDSLNRTHLDIYFSSDATFGETQPTELKLNHLQTSTNNCPAPTSYPILSLPVEKPEIVFMESIMDVPLCSKDFFLDIFNSKGLTNRKAKAISWNVVSVGSITTSPQRTTLDSLVNTNFANLRYIKFEEPTIASVSGKTVEFKVTVTNFHNQSSTSTKMINFLGTKKIIIQGVYPVYNLIPNHNHTFYLTTKIPFCTGEDRSAIAQQEKKIVVTCMLYENDQTTLVKNLTTSCTIPAGTMTYPKKYKIKFTATNPSDSSQTSTRWSEIHVKHSDLSVFINGGDRAITIDKENVFTANVEPKSDNIVYKWGCYEELTGSFCLSSDNQYLLFPNSPVVSIKPGSLFPNRNYRISCTATDIVNNESGKHSTIVQAKKGVLLDITIQSRHNKNGYIDYTQTALFVCSTQLSGVDIYIANATYVWTITDSTGLSVSLTTSVQLLNSLQIPGNLLVPNEDYTVKVTVNYKTYTGSTSILYSTKLDTVYSFEVEPSAGVGLSTEFIFSAASQSFDYELNDFSFGYVKGGSRFYLTRSSPVPLRAVILPQGEASDKLIVF